MINIILTIFILLSLYLPVYGFQWPVNPPNHVNGIITGVIGEYRGDKNKNHLHEGIDFNGPLCTPIYAIEDGVVTVKLNGTAFGNRYLAVKNDNAVTVEYIHIDHCGGSSSACSEKLKQVCDKDSIGNIIAIPVNATVVAGQVLGVTRDISPPHLHLEMDDGKHNPLKYLSPFVDRGKVYFDNIYNSNRPFALYKNKTNIEFTQFKTTDEDSAIEVTGELDVVSIIKDKHQDYGGKYAPYKICHALIKHGEIISQQKCNIIFDNAHNYSSDTSLIYDTNKSKGSGNNYIFAFWITNKCQEEKRENSFFDTTLYKNGFYDFLVYADDIDGGAYNISDFESLIGAVKQRIYINNENNGNPQDQYESDDSKAEATTITSGQTQHHNFHNSTDKDWYKFSVDSYSLVFIKTQGSESDRDTRLTIYNDDNNTWSFVTDTTYDRVGKNPTEYAEAVVFLQPGNYSFVVDGKESMFDYETLFFSFPECFFHNQSQSLSGAASSDFITTFAQEGTCNPVLKSPLPLSPGNIPYEDFETISTVQPTLHWDHGINCKRQELYISEYPYGKSNIVYKHENIDALQTSLQIPVGKLQNGKKYRWDMQTIDSFGNESESSHNLYFRVNFNSSIPEIPTSLTATDGSYENKIKVSWNNVPNTTTYKIYRCTSSSTNSYTNINSDLSSPYNDYNANLGQSYYYRVKACNNSACSDYSTADIGYRKTSSGGNPIIKFHSKTIDDDDYGESDGNDDNLVDAGEDIELVVVLKNIGDTGAEDVRGFLRRKKSRVQGLI